MDRIFQDAKDKNVSCAIIYGKSGKAYSDASCKTQMTTTELKEAVLKRAIIMIETNIYLPIGFSVASDIGTVKYITPNTTTNTSADIAGLAAVKD